MGVSPRKSSFAPIAGADARLLILGSLPGDASLAAGRYYAHPANQFWRLLGGAIGTELAVLDYDGRIAALRSAGVALWDVVASAVRPGSLDGAIREHQPNRLADLMVSLPHLQAIAFNGQTAAKLGRKMLPNRPALRLIELPSSSAAYCRIDFAAKQRQWDLLGAIVGAGACK